jgi:hypothetical protein
MPVQRISFSIVWLIFSLKLHRPAEDATLSIFSALHNFQATAVEAGTGAWEGRIPSKALATSQCLDLNSKSSIFAGWHVA